MLVLTFFKVRHAEGSQGEESKMAAPRKAPQGIATVTSHARVEGKMYCLGFGQDERVTNPGDLLIVMVQEIHENLKTQEIEMALKIRGQDIHVFIQAARSAAALWEENKDWLRSPVTREVQRMVEPATRTEDLIRIVAGHTQQRKAI